MKGKYDESIHHRRSLRLRGYDYSQPGAYFVTTCTEDRECLFGDVVDGEMILSEAGRVVQETWESIPGRFQSAVLDAFVVMPNHLHAIILLTETEGDSRPALGDIIGAFKSISAIGVNRLLSREGNPLWQRSYHDRILRSQKELEDRRQYIADNPVRWAEDEENPRNWIK